MNAETARLLALAIQTRDTAAAGMVSLLKRNEIETPGPVQRALIELAGTYVHEQRVINRIISEDADE